MACKHETKDNGVQSKNSSDKKMIMAMILIMIVEEEVDLLFYPESCLRPGSQGEAMIV